jgi:hypothetical protein
LRYTSPLPSIPPCSVPTLLLPPQPTGLQTGTAIAQIGAVARGQPIPDLSVQEVADSTLAAVLGQAPKEEKPVEGQNTEEPYEKQ